MAHIEAAVRDRIREYFIALDMELTGKSRHECEHTATVQGGQKIPPDEWWGMYYLSDGGYSRIAFSESEVWIASESLTRVKEAWGRPEVGKIVSNLRSLLDEVICEYGFEGLLEDARPTP